MFWRRKRSCLLKDRRTVCEAIAYERSKRGVNRCRTSRALPLSVGLLQAARLTAEVGDAFVGRGEGTRGASCFEVGPCFPQPTTQLLLETFCGDDFSRAEEHAVGLC